jgi:hypothetical protein
MAQPAQQEQQHPRASQDREIVNILLSVSDNPSDENLAELARLRVRYYGFPGAKDIQVNLDKLIEKWNLTEEELFEKTRQIHQTTRIYKGRSKKGDEEDWS